MRHRTHPVLSRAQMNRPVHRPLTKRPVKRQAYNSYLGRSMTITTAERRNSYVTRSCPPRGLRSGHRLYERGPQNSMLYGSLKPLRLFSCVRLGIHFLEAMYQCCDDSGSAPSAGPDQKRIGRLPTWAPRRLELETKEPRRRCGWNQRRNPKSNHEICTSHRRVFALTLSYYLSSWEIRETLYKSGHFR